MKAISSANVQGLALVCAASLLLAACNPQPQEALAAAPGMPAPAPTSVKTSVGTDIDDSVVTTRVKSALLADHDVKSFDIKVETRKGQVQLTGFVDTQARIDNAVALVSRVEGVKGVDNGMAVKDGKATVGNTIDDSIITAKVKSALLGDPVVKSSDIAVVTRKGEVQLSGYVTSQNQIDRAISVVMTVAGVQRVNNEMSIKQ